MKRLKNILFIADRQDGLTDALNRAVALSQSNAARLTVMDVIPDAGVADYIKHTYAIDFNTALREQRLQALEALTKPHVDAGVPAYTTISTGIMFIEVIRAVQRNAHDLVIKAAQQDTSFSRALFCSNDMHLLRKCPCPVWIDRVGGRYGYRRVLAAVDPLRRCGCRVPRIDTTHCHAYATTNFSLTVFYSFQHRINLPACQI